MKEILFKKATAFITAALMLFTPLMTQVGFAQTPTTNEVLENPEKIALILADYNNQCLSFRMEDMRKVHRAVLIGPFSPEYKEVAATIVKLEDFIMQASQDGLVKQMLKERLDVLNLDESLKDIRANNNCVVTGKGLLESAAGLSVNDQEFTYKSAWGEVGVDLEDLFVAIIEHLTLEQSLVLDLVNLERNILTVIEAAFETTEDLSPQSHNLSQDSLTKTLMSAAELLSSLIERPAFAQAREFRLERQLRGDTNFSNISKTEQVVSILLVGGVVAALAAPVIAGGAAVAGGAGGGAASGGGAAAGSATAVTAIIRIGGPRAQHLAEQAVELTPKAREAIERLRRAREVASSQVQEIVRRIRSNPLNDRFGTPNFPRQLPSSPPRPIPPPPSPPPPSPQETLNIVERIRRAIAERGVSPTGRILPGPRPTPPSGSGGGGGGGAPGALGAAVAGAGAFGAAGTAGAAPTGGGGGGAPDPKPIFIGELEPNPPPPPPPPPPGGTPPPAGTPPPTGAAPTGAVGAPADNRPFFLRPPTGTGQPQPAPQDSIPNPVGLPTFEEPDIPDPIGIPTFGERVVTIETVDPVTGERTTRVVTVGPGEPIDDTGEQQKEDKPKEDQPKEEQAKQDTPPPPEQPEGGEKPDGGEPGTQSPDAATAEELAARAQQERFRAFAERKLGPQSPVATTSRQTLGNTTITNPNEQGPSATARPGNVVGDPGPEVSGSGTTGTVSPSTSRDNLIFDPNRASSGGPVPLDAREGLDERRGTRVPEDASTTTTTTSPTPSTTTDKIAPSTSTTTTTTTLAPKTTISPDQTIVAVAPTTKESTSTFFTKDLLTKDLSINLSINKCAANYQTLELSSGLQNISGLPEVCRSTTCIATTSSSEPTPVGTTPCLAYVCRFQPTCSFGLVPSETSSNTQYTCVAPPPACHDQSLRLGLETTTVKTVTVCDDFTATDAALAELDKNTDPAPRTSESTGPLVITPIAGASSFCPEGYRFGSGSITDSHNYQYSCIAEQAQNPCIGTTLVGSADLDSCCAH